MGDLDDLEKASEEAAAETDALLQKEMDALRTAAASDLAALEPEVDDPVLFKKLMRAIAQSTAANESLVAFQTRIKALGSGAVDLAKKVAGLLP